MTRKVSDRLRAEIRARAQEHIDRRDSAGYEARMVSFDPITILDLLDDLEAAERRAGPDFLDEEGGGGGGAVSDLPMRRVS